MKYYLINRNSKESKALSIYYTTLVVAENREEAIKQFLLHYPYASHYSFFEENWSIYQCDTIVDGKYVTDREWKTETLKEDK
jgi:surface polysaccharide O-acyltransferase-like enzyme